MSPLNRAADAERRFGDGFPELPEAFDPPFRRVAGDQGRIDGADGDSGDPMWMEVRFGKRLIDAGLIGAQGSATLQQQCDSFEIRADREPCGSEPIAVFESIEVLLHRSAI